MFESLKSFLVVALYRYKALALSCFIAALACSGVAPTGVSDAAPTIEEKNLENVQLLSEENCVARKNRQWGFSECETSWIEVRFDPHSTYVSLFGTSTELWGRNGENFRFKDSDILEAASTINSLEYSQDGGKNWKPWPSQSNHSGSCIPSKEFANGFVPGFDSIYQENRYEALGELESATGQPSWRWKWDEVCIEYPAAVIPSSTLFTHVRLPGNTGRVHIRAKLTNGQDLNMFFVTEGQQDDVSLPGGIEAVLKSSALAGTESLVVGDYHGGVLALGNLGHGGEGMYSFASEFLRVGQDLRVRQLPSSAQNSSVLSLARSRGPDSQLEPKPRTVVPTENGFYYCRPPKQDLRRSSSGWKASQRPESFGGMATKGEVYHVQWAGNELVESVYKTEGLTVPCHGALYRTTAGEFISVGESSRAISPNNTVWECLRSGPKSKLEQKGCRLASAWTAAREGGQVISSGDLGVCPQSCNQWGKECSFPACDIRERATKQVPPCGSDAQGRPLGLIRANNDTLSLVRFNSQMETEKTLWSERLDSILGAEGLKGGPTVVNAKGVAKAAAWFDNLNEVKCGVAKDHVMFWRADNTAIFAGNQLVHSLLASNEQGDVKLVARLEESSAFLISTAWGVILLAKPEAQPSADAASKLFASGRTFEALLKAGARTNAKSPSPDALKWQVEALVNLGWFGAIDGLVQDKPDLAFYSNYGVALVAGGRIQAAILSGAKAEGRHLDESGGFVQALLADKVPAKVTGKDLAGLEEEAPAVLSALSESVEDSAPTLARQYREYGYRIYDEARSSTKHTFSGTFNASPCRGQFEVSFDGGSIIESFDVDIVDGVVVLKGTTISGDADYGKDLLLGYPARGGGGLRGGARFDKTPYSHTQVESFYLLPEDGRKLPDILTCDDLQGKWVGEMWYGNHLDNLGSLLARSVEYGGIEQAEKSLQFLSPWIPSERVAEWRAIVYQFHGRYDEALKMIESEGGDSLTAQRLKAELLVATDQPEKSLGLMRQLVAKHPKDETLVAALGVNYLRLGLYEQSVASLTEAKMIAEQNEAAEDRMSRYLPQILSNLAEAYLSLNQPSRAKSLIDEALKRAPNDLVLNVQKKRANEGPRSTKPSSAKGGEVAVLRFTTGGGAVPQVGLGETIAEMLVTKMVKDGASVVERARLDEILAEQDLQTTKRVDQTTAVRIGKLAAAKYLIVGNAHELGDILRLDARLVNVETGGVIKAESQHCKFDLDELTRALNKLGPALVP